MRLDTFFATHLVRVTASLSQPVQTFTPRVSPPVTWRAPWHGTLYGYAKRRCRCWECRESNAQYSAQRRERNLPDRRRYGQRVA